MRKQETIEFSSHDVTLEVTLFYDSEYGIEGVVEKVQDAIEINVSFYNGCKDLPVDFNLTLLNHRHEYDEILGWPSSSWGSGLTRDNNIYTFHPERRAVETSHSKESFVNTLTHEVSHIFSKSIFKKELWWTREGVAQYIAKQDSFKELSFENIEHFIAHSLDRNIKYSDFVNKHQGHQISKKMGYAIGEKFGPEALLSLLGVSPEDELGRLQIAKILKVSINNLEGEVRGLLSTSIKSV